MVTAMRHETVTAISKAPSDGQVTPAHTAEQAVRSRMRGTGSAISVTVDSTAQPSRIPAIVVLACLPLPATLAFGLFSRVIENASEPLSLVIGFAAALGYLVAFLPALYVFEPFAVIASFWYTQRYLNRFDESFARVLVCWAAVAVHSAVLVWYFRLGR